MKSFVKELALPPSVATLARCLAGAPGLAVLASGGSGLRPDDTASSFVLAFPDREIADLAPPDEEIATAWAGRAAAPRWVGVVPYETQRALEGASFATDARPAARLERPQWWRYPAALRVDHARGRVVVEADDARAAERLVAPLSGSPPSASFRLAPGPAFDRPADHAARVARALELIAAGDIYEVNLARRLRYQVEGEALELFFALAARAPSPYGFFLRTARFTVCGTSPELALEARGAALRTGPIKGTRPRGDEAASDAAFAGELDASEKERAELVMAIDLHRNDLGKVAVAGSVRLAGSPRLAPGRTVWSRLAEVTARRRPDVSVRRLLEATLPVGSVTGAPKRRAMQVIAELEPARRGLYTGAYGYVGRDGGLVLAVAIRTLEVAPDGAAEYGTGGGIVFGSDPARELEETAWKAAALDALA